MRSVPMTYAPSVVLRLLPKLRLLLWLCWKFSLFFLHLIHTHPYRFSLSPFSSVRFHQNLNPCNIISRTHCLSKMHSNCASRSYRVATSMQSCLTALSRPRGEHAPLSIFARNMTLSQEYESSVEWPKEKTDGINHSSGRVLTSLHLSCALDPGALRTWSSWTWLFHIPFISVGHTFSPPLKLTRENVSLYMQINLIWILVLPFIIV